VTCFEDFSGVYPGTSLKCSRKAVALRKGGLDESPMPS
jgi:hypothetical protein